MHHKVVLYCYLLIFNLLKLREAPEVLIVVNRGLHARGKG